MPGLSSRTKITAAAIILAAVVVLAGVSIYRVSKAQHTGNPREIVISVLRENEDRFALDFGYFYPFSEPRGMTPMTMTDPAGKKIVLDDFRGQIVLLHFWATWCPPCIKELPTLRALQERSEGKGFKILTVSLDYGKEAAEIVKFMKKHGAESLPALIVSKDDPSWAEFSGFGLPTSFLIGPDGRVLYKMIGDADWSSPATYAFIDDVLTN